MSHSQIGQDLFVLKSLDEKRDGIFVDIGAGHPIRINNTYLLETSYNWSGISLDYGKGAAYKCRMSDERYFDLWNEHRKTPLIIENALKVDFAELFNQHNLPTVIDYLSIDLEPPHSTFQCLLKIPFDQFTFKVITFEHDDYRKTRTRVPSRALLEYYGYKYVRSNKENQEDWYICNQT